MFSVTEPNWATVFLSLSGLKPLSMKDQNALYATLYCIGTRGFRLFWYGRGALGRRSPGRRLLTKRRQQQQTARIFCIFAQRTAQDGREAILTGNSVGA